MYLAITGRERKLAIAELEALFDSALIQPFGDDAALIDSPTAPELFAQLGSSIKLCRVLDIVDYQSFEPKHWLSNNLELIELTSNRKMNLGISCYGAEQLHRTLFHELNSQLSAAGKNVRTINPKHRGRMSSAQVFHNKLDMPRNLEFVAVKASDKLALAATTNIQNITAYRVRDRDRPRRDSFVGMLPPKLAQTLINFCGLSAQADGLTLLDPFCGTGVNLMEASLMGFRAYGTDIEPRMIEYSQDNLDWLAQVKSVADWRLEAGDATNHNWQPPIDAVVSEIYLGKPLSSEPSLAELQQLQQQARQLVNDFLLNIHPQLQAGTPLVLAVPAWRQRRQFRPALTLDDLEGLGYASRDFVNVSADELLYARPDQIVGRKILVINKN